MRRSSDHPTPHLLQKLYTIGGRTLLYSTLCSASFALTAQSQVQPERENFTDLLKSIRGETQSSTGGEPAVEVSRVLNVSADDRSAILLDLFAIFDVDKDNKLSKTEFQKLVPQLLSWQENENRVESEIHNAILGALLKEEAPQIQKEDSEDPQEQSVDTAHKALASPQNQFPIFSRAPKKKPTQEEEYAFRKEIFDLIDQDQDQVLSETELMSFGRLYYFDSLGGTEESFTLGFRPAIEGFRAAQAYGEAEDMNPVTIKNFILGSVLAVEKTILDRLQKRSKDN